MDEETLIEFSPDVMRVWRGPRGHLHLILNYIQTRKALYGRRDKCDVSQAIKVIGINSVLLLKASTPDQARGHESDIVFFDELPIDANATTPAKVIDVSTT